MYLAHWGLRESPFRGVIDPRAFFASSTHEEALARLRFLIDGHRRSGLLLGAPGSGKSLVLEVLAAQERRRGRMATRISLLGLDKEEFLAALAVGWGLDPQPGTSHVEQWRMVLDRAAEYRLQKLDNVVLLDDADEASPAVLDQVVRLAMADIAGAPAATVLLAARTNRVGRLTPRLLELAELRIDLLPWDVDSTQQYLEAGLARCGRDEPAFTYDAVLLLAELAGGVPRHVVQLADLALVAAAGQKLPAVDLHTVEAVYAELGLVHQVAEVR